MSQSNKVTVVARNISKTYTVSKSNRSVFSSKHNAVEALRDVSFIAQSGECIGILGKNGSGKSTLLNIIAGNEEATSGMVRVSEQPTLLGVSAALQPQLSGQANVRLGLLAMGLNPREVSSLISPVLEWADLSKAAERPMETYSAGMKSRLKFAIATAVNREILMVDEALSTGDATFADKARERMSTFLKNAGTVFIVSHSANTIQKHCTRVIWLHEGQVIADGTTKRVLRSYKLWTKRTAAKNTEGAEMVIKNAKNRYSSPKIYLESEYQEYKLEFDKSRTQREQSVEKHRTI